MASVVLSTVCAGQPESPMSCRLPEQHKESLPIPLWECKELKIMTSRVTVEEPRSLSLSAYGKARSTIQGSPLTSEELREDPRLLASVHLSGARDDYLQANPLLKESLKPEHIKNRLLGHWGSSPGMAFTYIHLNRLIKKLDLDVIFMAGPGHGAPGVLGPGYLEGTYSEIYPEKSEDELGLREFFKQFSFPGGSEVTARRRLPVRSTKEANWATCSRMPAVRRSTTLT